MQLHFDDRIISIDYDNNENYLHPVSVNASVCVVTPTYNMLIGGKGGFVGVGDDDGG